MKNFKHFGILLIAFSLTIMACDDEPVLPADPCENVTCGANEVCDDGTCVSTLNPTTVKTAEDIPADVNNTDEPSYFSLSSGTVVDAGNLSSTNWDVAFDGTTIYLNGGTSGTGAVQAQVLTSTLFDELEVAPTSGYKSDDEDGDGLAIPTGSGNGWYAYAGPPTHAIAPIGGVVIVLKTANGNYAKLQILSYYKGNPDLSQYTVSPPVEPSGYYTFKYAVQTDGTTNLK